HRRQSSFGVLRPGADPWSTALRATVLLRAVAMEPMRLTKDLMIVRAGPRSLHPTWLDHGKPRNWDLFICPYEEVPPPAGATGLLLSQVIPGSKWSALKVLLQKWQGWRDYRYVMLADEDLFATQDTWSRFFEKSAACGAKLAQPAFAEDAPYRH